MDADDLPQESPSLAEMYGLGPASAEMLRAAGIRSPDELRTVGAALAFLRVRQAGLRPSKNLLWAIEGALTGRHWTDLADGAKRRLLEELARHGEP